MLNAKRPEIVCLPNIKGLEIVCLVLAVDELQEVKGKFGTRIVYPGGHDSEDKKEWGYSVSVEPCLLGGISFMNLTYLDRTDRWRSGITVCLVLE